MELQHRQPRGMLYRREQQATVIGLLRTQLNNVGLTDTAIAASDENSYSLAVSTWNSFSSSTQSQVGWVQIHGYQLQRCRRHPAL